MTQIIKSNGGGGGGGKYTAGNGLQLVGKEFSIDTDVVAQKSDLGTAASKDTGTSAGNVPVLDANGKLNTTVVPAVAITDTFTINSSSDLTGLTTAEKGDVAICPSEGKTYILYADPYSVAANWKLLPTPTDAVSSVNGKTGVVTLDADDISDSTTTNKFVTAAEKSTWSGKQNALTAGQGINITGSTIKTTYNYGESTTAAATAQKEVSIPGITELNVGQVVIVKPTITSTVADSTLKVNSFTAYPMLYNGAAITTSTDSIVWTANVPSMFILDDVSGTKYWRFLGHGLDSNTTYSINYSYDAGKMKSGSGSYAISRYSICMQKNNGTWEKITATNANYSTGTSKSVNTNGFIPTQIRYYSTTTNLANGAFAAVNTLYDKCAKLTASYSFNCGTAPGWAVGDNIYLVGTFHTDGLFYLDSTKRWDNALPTSNNGKYYIWIGNALTTTDSTMTLSVQHPIFFHDGTSIREYYTDKQDRISDLSTIRSGAAAGATAVQPGDLSGYQTTSNLVTNLTSPDDTHYPSAKAVADALSSAGAGDMLKSVYDPNSVEGDVYDYNNFINTPTIPTNTSDLNNDSGFVTNQVDDTAYASSWDGVTTKAPSQNAVYDKINSMDTTIGNKANDSDVVKLTGNQTIAGTKTFSTSPVVPSKSTDAANTDTAIATEAQVYKKQDKLTTQTAYTSKGTATKVPTITTNTLGQVTAITETSITFPVTSVNGSTGAVTGLQTTANLKTDLTDDSDSYYPSQKAVKTAVDGKQDSFYTSASSAPATPSEGDQWYDTTNDVLKVYDGSNWNEVGGGGSSYNAGPGISIGNVSDYSAMRGPCPEGFHIPTKDEWTAVETVWTTLGGGGTDGVNFSKNLKLPRSGGRGYSDADIVNQGSYGLYWSCTHSTSTFSYYASFSSSSITTSSGRRTSGYTVRGFKDSSVVPTDSWTKLYGTSIELGGIFWNPNLGLISLSGNGSTWITISDRNLGATQVWNDGDTLSESNCGKYYQRGNNYGFPFTGTIANQSTTQVDASTYGPGNYYSSDTYIKYNGSWDSSNSSNLRGETTGVVTISNAISNTGVLSVNGYTGNVLVQAQHSTLSLTLAAASWSSSTITVTATGVTASNTVIVSPAPASFADYTSAAIYCSAQSTDSLTFSCTTEPTSDITVNVLILN